MSPEMGKWKEKHIIQSKVSKYKKSGAAILQLLPVQSGVGKTWVSSPKLFWLL